MQKIKMIWITAIFIMLMSFTFSIYADDEIGEVDITKEEIDAILEASSDVNDIPVINSRNAVIYDRLSRKNIIWKERKYKMQNGINYKNYDINSSYRKHKKFKRESKNI